MSWRKHLLGSLAGRLILSLFVAILASLALWLFFFHLLVRNELYGSFDRSLVVRMQSLAAYAVKNPGAEGTAEFMPEFRTQQHLHYFEIWDARGTVLARADSGAGRDLPRLAGVLAAPTFYDGTMPDGHRGRVAVQNFAVPEGDPRQVITVAMAGEVEQLDELEQRLHLFFLVGSLATAAVAVLIATFSVRRSLRPVDRWSRSVSAIDPGNPDARLDIAGLPTELQPVAGKIKVMTEQLIEALDRERRFARNVAHELRTPLAEARMLAEVGALADDCAAARGALEEINKTTQELEQIVESLLSLSRYESGIQKPELEPVDVASEVRHQAAYLEAVTRARGLDMRIEMPDEAWVHTDAPLTQRLVANLVGNAVAHAPAGATVLIRLERDGALSIANPAPQLTREDLPRLGERFFRIHSGNGGAHAGLGLSLARAIARVLELRFELTLTDDHRLVARVTGFRPLPSAPAEHPV